jgi:hypothetical protein
VIEPLATSIDATEPARNYLSPYERDLWLHDQFIGGNGYSVDHCFRFDGSVDAERLSRAMANLVRAHPRLGQAIRSAPTSGYPFWSETEPATGPLPTRPIFIKLYKGNLDRSRAAGRRSNRLEPGTAG